MKLFISLITLAAAPLWAASISVMDYGAAGNGAQDDAAAIQSAIDNSIPGDTIQFPAGAYRVSTPINLASNRIYQGVNATLYGPGGNFILVMPPDGAVNITISGLTLNGGGISTKSYASAAKNIKVTYCTFTNITVTAGDNWTVNNGIFMPAATNGAVIAHNRFINIFAGGDRTPGDTYAYGVWAQNWNNVSFTDNTFDQVNEAIYLNFSGGNYSGVVIARNVGIGIHRMGIEMQRDNSPAGLLVDSNQFSNFLNPFWNTFGFSIDGGIGTVISSNVVDANLPVDPGGAFYGYDIEVMGEGVLVANNQILHMFSSGVAVGPSTNISITNNLVCGFTSGYWLIEEPGTITGLVTHGNTIQDVCNHLLPEIPASY